MDIKGKFDALVAENHMEDKVTVNTVGCFGFCSQGPFVKILPEDTLYRLVKVEDVEEIFNTDILGGKVNNVGLVEILMGTTLRELIYDIGGGMPYCKLHIEDHAIQGISLTKRCINFFPFTGKYLDDIALEIRFPEWYDTAVQTDLKRPPLYETTPSDQIIISEKKVLI